MDKIEDAIQTVHKLDMKNGQKSFLNEIHPTIKLLLTIIYIILLTSIDKYNLTTTLSMSIYLIILGIICDISAKEILKRFKIIFLLLFVISIANPILDRNIVTYIGIVPISTGLISMTTLILKGFFAVVSSYFLISTTNIEEICFALKKLHIPNILVITVMLIYRYIILFLKEAQRIWIAYSLRAPKQKGINYKVWGSMIGSLLIRSIDRAIVVYQSMELRGFDAEHFLVQEKAMDYKSILCLFLGISIIAIIRFIPVFEIIGTLFI